MSETSPFRAGQRFEGYEIRRIIGRGGNAFVVQARDVVAQRDVALKIIPARPDQRDYRQRARDEARLLSRLRHPNVVHVFDAGVSADGAFTYFAMELLRGRTLREVLNRAGRLSIPESLTLAGQVCDGLQAAHLLQVIHRDLKPENVFIEPGNRAKVLDFGIAKFMRGGLATPDRSRWRGTPLYMSPEHLRGQALDVRSDVYALGVVIYEMLSGRHPCSNGLEEPSHEEVGWIQMASEPPALSEVMPEIPGYVSEVVARAIAKRREDRFPSIGELGLALRRALHASLEDAKTCGLQPVLRELVTLEAEDRRRRSPEAPRVSGIPEAPAGGHESARSRELVRLAANDAPGRRDPEAPELRLLAGGARAGAGQRSPLAADAIAPPQPAPPEPPARAFAGASAALPMPRAPLGPVAGLAIPDVRIRIAEPRPLRTPAVPPAPRDEKRGDAVMPGPDQKPLAKPRGPSPAPAPARGAATQPNLGVCLPDDAGRAPQAPDDSGIARRWLPQGPLAAPAGSPRSRVPRWVRRVERAGGLRMILSGAALGVAIGVGLGLIVPIPRAFHDLWSRPPAAAEAAGHEQAEPGGHAPAEVILTPPPGAIASTASGPESMAPPQEKRAPEDRAPVGMVPMERAQAHGPSRGPSSTPVSPGPAGSAVPAAPPQDAAPRWYEGSDPLPY